MENEPQTSAEWSDRNPRFAAFSAAAGLIRGAWRDAGLVTPAKTLSRRGVFVAAALLTAILVFLHVKAQSDEVTRTADVLAQLATSKLIDARWDVAVLQAQGANPGEAAAVRSRDVATIQRALDSAARLARSNALLSDIAALKKAYVEKADLVTRHQQASGDSQQALEAAMRADSGVGNLVRNAWRDFPQRERLVAAENLVARVLAEAQQYQRAPTAAHRSALESAAGDLPEARELPAPVLAALSRLASDVHRLLLLKPLEQMLGERLTVLNTAARVDEVAETFRRSLSESVTERTRYRIALFVYSLILALLAAYWGVRVYRNYRALEVELEAQSAELAEARTRLRGLEEDAIIIEESSAEVVPLHAQSRTTRKSL